jgi:hypothetical protein
MTARSYRSALRQAFRCQSDGPDMDAVARHAIQLLDEEMVVQAALTHIRQMARREWNRLAGDEAEGWSADVVNLDGVDFYLGDASEDDRAELAKRRDVLADGLKSRAAAIRSGGGERTYSQREVLKAERQAKSAIAAVESLAELLDSGKLEQATLSTVQQRQERTAAYGAATDRLLFLASKLVPLPLASLPKTRRAVAAMARDLNLEVAA